MSFFVNILLLYSLFQGYIQGYTRKYRLIEIKLPRYQNDDITVIFDPISININISTQFICLQFGCSIDNVNNNDGNYIKMFSEIVIDGFNRQMAINIDSYCKEIFNTYSNYITFNRNRIIDINSWLNLTDILTSSYLSNISNNINYLPYFKYRKVTDLSLISNEILLSNYDLLLDYNNISIWLSTMLSLFHNGDYYLVDMMLCIYLNILNHSIEGFYSISLIFQRNLFILLSEISRINNRLDWSIYWSYQVMNNSYPFIYTEQSIIHRLRMILTIPIYPLNTIDNQIYRNEMINDLNSLLYEINFYNTTFTYNDTMNEVLFTTFHMSHQGLNDKAIQLIIQNIYSKLFPSFNYISPHLLDSAVTYTDSNKKNINIGLISLYFNNHSIGKILLDTILVLNQISNDMTYSYKFTIYVLYITFDISDDLSCNSIHHSNIDISKFPGYTQVYASQLTDNFIFLSTNLTKIHDCLSGLLLDVLIYTDIGMDFISYSVAFSRLATYQICWWGHPITTGLPSIDYYFSLDYEIHDASFDHYTEQLVRFRYMSSAPMQQIEIVNNIEEKIEVFKFLNMSISSKYLYVLGKLFKIHPLFLSTIIEILSKSKIDCYVVVIAERNIVWNDLLYNMIKNYSNNNDVIISRFRFINYQHYYKILPYAHVVLDTFPYGGCLTTHDSLCHSIPLVTLPAEFLRGRFSSAMYNQMGFNSLIANSTDNYIDIILELLSNNNYYNNIQRQLIASYNSLHKNRFVAEEWLEFIGRLFEIEDNIYFQT